jgi:hypothetical protein
VRSAGHGISGRSTNRNGLVISVASLNSFEVLDEERRLVRIGPGRTWKQVAHDLVDHGWALGSGDYGGVGVGGLATAGGIGLLSRKHGLTIDHLRAVELVLADGTPVRASETENPDLFWAVRGAGANFGIATAFEFETSVVGAVGSAQLTLVTSDIEQTLHRYGELATAAPRDTTVYLVTGRGQQGRWAVQLFAVVDHADPDVVVERLTAFLDLGLLVEQNVVMTPYPGVTDNAADVGPEGHRGTASRSPGRRSSRASPASSPTRRRSCWPAASSTSSSCARWVARSATYRPPRRRSATAPRSSRSPRWARARTDSRGSGTGCGRTSRVST